MGASVRDAFERPLPSQHWACDPWRKPRPLSKMEVAPARGPLDGLKLLMVASM